MSRFTSSERHYRPFLSLRPSEPRKRKRRRAPAFVRLTGQQLESRLALTTALDVSGTYSINSYSGVGFQENQVATFTASVNGQADPNVSDFSAQIQWGDGGQSSGSLVYLGTNGSSAEFEVKGSHVYQQLESNLKINVTVTGQGASETAQTALADVAAMPSGIAGTKPTQYGSSSPANVSINVAGTYSIDSFTGVGFEENEVATLNVSLNDKPDTTLSDLHAQINYGDDAFWSTGDLVYLGNNGSAATYEVKGTHVYKSANTNVPIVVYVNGPDGTSASGETALANITNMPSGIPGTVPETFSNSAPANVSINVAGTYSIDSFTGVGFQENEVATLNVSLNNKPVTTLSDLHAQINFGDDNSWSTGDLVYLGNNGSAATYEVKGTHVYTSANTNVPIVVYVNGPDGTSASGQTALANITDMPSGIPGKQPTQYGTASPENVAINVAGTYSVDSYAGIGFTNKEVATLTISVNGQPDDTLGDLHAQINYGDDASWTSGTLVFQSDNGSASFYEIEGSHVYKKTGTNIPIVVYVNGPDGTSASGQTAFANVSPNPNTMSATATPITATEGDSFSGSVATFTDTNTDATASDFTATITWADGSTSDGTISSSGHAFEVSADYTFLEEGTQAVSVAISGDDGTSATVQATATVKDAAISATAAPVAATESSPFSGTVANFGDADPNGAVGDYTATIDWGDGTMTPGTIATAAGGFAVNGSHTYTEEGTPSVRVVVNDDGGSSVTASGTATVKDASLSASGQSVSATEGITFSGTVANFSDADPNGTAGDYSATITWGDGTTTPGTISTAAGGFAVNGTHAYGAYGDELFYVVIKDVGGSTATASGTASLGDAPLSATGTSVSATEGEAFTGTVATFTDANSAATANDYSVNITWGDGTAAAGTVAAVAGGFAVTGAHTYAQEGQNIPITVAIEDTAGAQVGIAAALNQAVVVRDAGTSAAGAKATATSTATVADAPLTALGASPNATTPVATREPAIAVNPANPNQIFLVGANAEGGGGLWTEYSSDGGKTWTQRKLATGQPGTDNLPAASNNVRLAYDPSGKNFFLTYLGANSDNVILLRTSDPSQPFSSWNKVYEFDHNGVDYPWVSAGSGRVWLTYTNGTSGVVATSAPISSSGVGTFSAPIAVDPSGQYPTIAAGPGGQALVADFNNGHVLAALLNASMPSGSSVALTDLGVSNTGNVDLPAQQSTYTEPALAWDLSNRFGPSGRAYLSYLTAPSPDSQQTRVVVRTFNGTNWSGPVTVSPIAAGAPNVNSSQFSPSIAVDQSTGNVAVSWYDTRNDPTNVSTQTYVAISNDGGQTFTSGPASNDVSSAAAYGRYYGDYAGLAFSNGNLFPAWADTASPGAAGRMQITTTRVVVQPSPLPSGPVRVAQFIDQGGAEPATNYQVTIDWGDGTTDTTTGHVSLVAGNQFDVFGTHAYTDTNPHAILTTIKDKGGSTVTIEGFVAAAPPLPLAVADDSYVIGSGTITVSAANGVLQNDTGPSQLTVTSTAVTGGEGGRFTFNADGSFSYTPPASFPGFDDAKYTAQDASGDSATATVDVLSQPGGVIWKFFEQVLHRDPAPSDLAFFIPQLATYGTGVLSADFFESDELLNQLITGFYTQYLGRPPQGNDLVFWGAKWRSYGGPELIIAQFASSTEFNNLADSLYAQAGASPAPWITALYERILNRVPRPGIDVPFWVQQLASGTTEGQVALDFVASQEGFGNDVIGWFQEYLGRAPTASEQTGYVNEMLAGASDRAIEQAITNLPEYANAPPASPAGTGVRLPNYLPATNTARVQASLAATDAVFDQLA